MSHAKPADQREEIAAWIHPHDAHIIREAVARGEGTASGIIRECVSLCMAFGLRPWRLIRARHHLAAAAAAVEELREMIRAGEEASDVLQVLQCAAGEIAAAMAESTPPPVGVTDPSAPVNLPPTP